MKKQIFYLMITCVLFGINLTGIVWTYENDLTLQFAVHLILVATMGGLAIAIKNTIFEKLNNITEITKGR